MARKGVGKGSKGVEMAQSEYTYIYIYVYILYVIIQMYIKIYHLDNLLVAKGEAALVPSSFEQLKWHRPSQELDTEAVESQILAVWYKSLHDLPDMAELRNAFK